jgi:hypothetical protein
MVQTISDSDTLERLTYALYVWGTNVRLVCGKCSCEARYEIKKHTAPGIDIHRSRAAEDFCHQGWRWSKMAICPTCLEEQAEHVG